jgi:hypothetical protein
MFLSNAQQVGNESLCRLLLSVQEGFYISRRQSSTSAPSIKPFNPVNQLLKVLTNSESLANPFPVNRPLKDLLTTLSPYADY